MPCDVERIITEASELIQAMMRDEDINLCQWCCTPVKMETPGGCEGCCIYSENTSNPCLFRLATSQISEESFSDQEMLEAMTEHNFHMLREACDKYSIRGKMLRLLCDYCGVPI